MIKDENTKFGTEIDGVKVEAGTERIFNDGEHTFRMGKIQHYFRYVAGRDFDLYY